jgi:tetratricopeptide (TPR) repeat protein
MPVLTSTPASVSELVSAGRYREALPLAEQTVLASDERSPDPLALLNLAHLHRELGRYDAAEEACLQALPLLAADKESLDYARGLRQLARVYEADGRDHQAEPLDRQALATRRLHLGDDHPETAESLADLGTVLDFQGYSDEGEALLRQALEIRRRHLGDDHPDTARSLLLVARTISGQGQPDEAARLARQALETLRRLLPADHPDLALAFCRAGYLQFAVGRFQEAEQMLREALRLVRNAFGQEHSRYADCLEGLGWLRATQGCREEAEQLIREALACNRATLGDDHPFTADSQAALAWVLEWGGEWAEAERILRQALTISRNTRGPAHPRTLRIQEDLGGVLLAANRADEAEPLLRQALQLLPATTSPDTARAHLRIELARCLTALNRLEEARSVARQALEESRASHGDNLGLAPALHLLANLIREEEPDVAGTYFREAVGLLERIMGPEHPGTLEAQTFLASHLHQIGDLAGAEKVLRQVLEHLDRSSGSRPVNRFSVQEQLAAVLWTQGKMDEAETLYLELLRARERALGPAHPDVAATCVLLAGFYEQLGNVRAAEIQLTRALELREQHAGTDSAEYGKSLGLIAGLLHRTGRVEEANRVYEQALNILQVADSQGLDLALVSYWRALLLRDLGDADGAEPLFTRALEVYRDKLGPRALQTLQIQQSLSVMHRLRGEYDQAAVLLDEVVAPLRAGSSPHPLAETLAERALLECSVGDYLAARPLFEEAKVIKERLLGPNHPHSLLTAQHLAEVHRCLGDHDAAEALARSILERVCVAAGADSLDAASAKILLAEHLGAQAGRADEARGLLEQAHATRRTILGRQHPLLADTLTRRAFAICTPSQYRPAEQLQREAVALLEAAYGSGHPEIAEGQRRLATLLRLQGRTSEADAMLQKTLATLRRFLIEPHPVLVPGLTFRAELARLRGDHASADDLYREALSCLAHAHPSQDGTRATLLRERARILLARGQQGSAESLLRQALALERSRGGDDHPGTVYCLRLLSTLCAATDREAEALTLLEEAVRHEDRLTALAAGQTNAVERSVWARDMEERMRVGVALVARHFDRSAQAVEQACTWVLRRKGLAEEALAVPCAVALARRHPERAEQLQRLVHLDRQLAARALNGPGLEGLEVHRRLLARWQQQRDDLARELSEQLPELVRQQRSSEVDVATVAAALPAGSVLIEFVQAVEARMDGPNTSTSRSWFAFVIPAGRAEALRLIDLGPVERIDELVEAWRGQLAAGSTAAADETARELSHYLLRPLLEVIGSAEHLLLSPDGGLHRLPFAALPLPDGRLLLDRCLLTWLGRGRDVLRFRSSGRRPSTSPVVLADPPTADCGKRPGWWSGLWRRLTGWWTRQELSEAALPGAHREGERIGGLLGVPARTADEARKALSHGSPHLLHLATCCFTPAEPAPADPQGPVALWENAWKRQALALAGTAAVRQNDTPRAEGAVEELLTAEEISALDLGATALVVLSLREIGPGRATSLRLGQPFLLAGARTVVAGLWDAPEQPRQDLLEQLYRAILAGQPSADALRQAQLAVRASHPDPHCWAGFVCSGDPGSV